MFTNHAHKGEQHPGDYERTVDMLRRSGEENERLREALAFAASAIKSGEPWTDTCETKIGSLLKHK